MSTTTAVGWIGTDHLSPSAISLLLSSNHTLTIFSPAPHHPFVSLGATLSPSLPSLARSSSILFLSSPPPPDLLPCLSPSSTLILMPATTSNAVTPSLAADLAEAARSVSCSSVDVVKGGDGTAFAGGELSTVERVTPVLNCIGFERVQCIGGPGTGLAARIGVRIAMAESILGLVEGLVYAKKAGVDVARWVEMVGGLGGLVEGCGRRMVGREMGVEDGVGVSVGEFVGELGVCLKECERVGVIVPGLAVARQLYLSLVAHREGELGVQGLLLAVERLSNVSVGKKETELAEDAGLQVSSQPVVGTSKLKMKANWTPELHRLFVTLCREQANAGNKPGTSLNKEGWKCVMDEFHKRTGIKHDKKQFKNHWDNTKEQWKVWKKLTASIPEYRSTSQAINRSEEWWTEYLQENPDAAQFRYKGLPLANWLDTLFASTTTSETTTLSPPALQAALPNVDVDSSKAFPGHDIYEVKVQNMESPDIPELVTEIKVQNIESSCSQDIGFNMGSQLKVCTSNGKLKANWTPELHKLFVTLCLDQVVAGNRPRTCLTKVGWKNMMDEFCMKTGLVYHKKQFKNHWNSTKEQWRIWKKLTGSIPGLTLDPSTQMINQSEEWWVEYLQLHPEAAQFRYKGLPLVDTLDTLFSSSATSDTTMWTPSPLQTASPNVDMDSSQAPSDQNNNEDGTTPGLPPETRVQNEESPCSRGEFNGEPPFRRRKLSHDAQSFFSQGKRELESASLNTKLVRLCEAIESRNTTTSTPNEEYTMKQCINLLHEIPEIPQGSELYMFALDVFLKMEHRELFILLDTPEMRHRWLGRQKLLHPGCPGTSLPG